MTERPRKIGSLVPTRAEILAGPRASRPDRCPIALVTGTRDHLTQETVDLLRRRLGVAALIALAPMAFFFFLYLAEGEPALVRRGAVGMALHGLVVGVLTFLTAVLWSGRPLPACRLRWMELLLFGTT